jgi:heme exporter protein A
LTLVSAKKLMVGRAGVALLSDLSFRLNAREAVILTGANGIGKTTLLRVLAGLQSPMAGELQVAEDCVAYAGHEDGLKPTLSLRENLQFWAQTYGNHGVEPALGRFGLSAFADRAALTLSAGQKRRLGLARLTLTGRKLWLLDEPTVSLDAASIALLESVLAKHLTSGGAAIIATHSPLDIPGGQVLDLTAYRATHGQSEWGGW